MSAAFDHDDFADLDVDQDPDAPTLDDAAAELSEEQIAAAEWLYGGRDPLAYYGTPVTRRCKPDSYGRDMHDVLPTL